MMTTTIYKMYMQQVGDCFNVICKSQPMSPGDDDRGGCTMYL